MNASASVESVQVQPQSIQWLRSWLVSSCPTFRLASIWQVVHVVVVMYVANYVSTLPSTRFPKKVRFA